MGKTDFYFYRMVKIMILKNFIVFEGIDGAGTSTQLNILKESSLEIIKQRFLFTAEPTPSPTGKFLRQMLKGDIPLQMETAAFVFAADRNEHINGELVTEGNMLSTGIKKATEQGKIVISDRYLFSSLAYQSIQANSELPRLLNSIFPLPSLLFYFEIKPETSLKRITGRGVTEIYEKESFLNQTVEQYHKILNEYSPENKGAGMKIVIIDATKSKEEIAEQIWDEISAIIDK